MLNSEKEVWYHIYCSKCKYRNTSDSDEPCNGCLSTPFNTDSHKPVNYEEEQ